MQPYFSIIIPTRSLTEYLAKETLPAIDSLQYTSYEVIVLADDIKKFDHLKKKYAWLRVVQSTGRPGKKRDEGAKKAQGEFLAFIDDDAFPQKDWLSVAHNILHNDKSLVALGGPGVLPKNAQFWEKVFDESMVNVLGGGEYRYRFRPMTKRFVDDYPSMNLIINRQIFLKIGGFNNNYWPGEDSKLGNTLAQQENKQILYHPDLIVFHHRRSSIGGHVRQYRQYGTMRGMFFTQGDTNSIKFQYVIPSLLTMYFVLYVLSALLYWVKPFDHLIFLVISIPATVYTVMLFFVSIQSLLHSKNTPVALSLLFIVPLTHIVYGYFFFVGTLKEIFKT